MGFAVSKKYKSVLSVSVNIKGVLDVDTVKGCSMGVAENGKRGCYGLCYACKMAAAYGMDFSSSVSRQPLDCDLAEIEKSVRLHNATWFRIGTMGDPSHDWPLTLYVCEWLGKIKTPVIVTKHWREMPAAIAKRLSAVRVIVNTSTSAMDTDEARQYRIGQHYRMQSYGIRAFLRVVTAKFGETESGRYMAMLQNWIMMHGRIIDTPLRIQSEDYRVKNGTIMVERLSDMNTETTISRWNNGVYVGRCNECPDQCGAIA